ncbi:MAG: hypothetical protein ACFFDY_03175 [Candidatus Thorarchaeota archaeon]
MKLKKSKFKIIIFLIVLSLSSVLFYDPFIWKLNKNQNNHFKNIENPEIALDEPNGKPLFIHQYANISNEYIQRSLPVNVSFTLIQGWTSKNITINYEGVSQKKDWVYNGDFHTNSSGWSYEEVDTYGRTDPNVYVDWDGNPEGCRQIKVSQGTYAEGDMAYYTQDFSIPESFSSKTASFSFDYKYGGNSLYPTNGSVYMAIIINGYEENKTLNFKDIAIGEWNNLKMLYNPVTSGQVLPGNVTVRVGMSINADCSKGGGGSELNIDNVKFEPWTQPNEARLLRAFDHELSQNFTYNNITYGNGYSFIDFERTRVPTDQVVFTIYKNTTGMLDFSIDSIIIYSYAVKIFNSSISGIDGTLYVKGEEIEWFFELPISIPFGYICWAAIEKPIDWEFISILDGFLVEQKGNCLGTNIGSNCLIILNDVLSSGLWQLYAFSQNYIVNADLLVWNSTQFINKTFMNFNDKFKIEVALNNSINLATTIINVSIFYPNNSIYLQNIMEPTSYNVEFGNYSVGKNMTTGQYRVEITWTNQIDHERDQVGYTEIEFIIWHYTNLTALQEYFEVVAGDPLLIKVKFIDCDFNQTIDFASIIYNVTFGMSGTMTYQGLGQYFVDLDTSSLSLGDYYLSVNATKTYYESQSIKDIIHIKIIAQSLVLQVPHNAISAMANYYATCRVNVIGAISGALICAVNLTTDWENSYSVIDYNNGTYFLNFSTWDLPNQGIIETFTISIFANKSNYGMATGFVVITIYPIQTIVNVNKSIVNANLNEIVDLKVNYTVESSGALILGANCSVIWDSTHNIIPDPYGFTVRLNTINLSIDTYTAIIKLEKAGFATIYKTITVIINRMAIQVNTMGFQDSIEALNGELIIVKINLTEHDTEIYIENATIFYEWEFGKDYFNYVGHGTYELELKLELPENTKGNYRMDLIISKEDSIYMTTEYSFIITITEEVEISSNNLVWYIVYGLLGIIGIFGIISLRTYVFLPRKRKKESELLARTQKYKDVMNIEAILISARKSGLNIYSKSYFAIEKFKNELLSGFVQAITLISDEIIGEKNIEKFSFETSERVKGIEKVINLDFKYFNFLICDYEDIRIVYILKEKASERLKAQTAELLLTWDSNFSDVFKKWDGDLDKFNKFLPPLLDEYLHLYYKEEFKLNTMKEINKVKKELNLSKMELRLINVINSMTVDDKNFYLKDSIDLIHVKKKELVIEALESLIERSIILPSSR